jgi:hypothetical protein
MVSKGAYSRITLAPVIATRNQGSMTQNNDTTDLPSHLRSLPDDLQALWKASQDEDHMYM